MKVYHHYIFQIFRFILHFLILYSWPIYIYTIILQDKNAFISFIEDKRWSTIEPLPSYKHPNSPQMGVVAVFFKLSMAVRDFHNHLVENVGIPSWASYLAFATVTLALGCVLGFVIILNINSARFLIFPPLSNLQLTFIFSLARKLISIYPKFA